MSGHPPGFCMNCDFNLRLDFFGYFQTSIPVSAPSAGVIAEFFVNDGDKVEKGQQLFKLVLRGMLIVL